MKVQVLGLGWVTPGGMGPARSAGGFSLGGGELPELERRDVFGEPYQRFGRLDRFSRLGLAAIAFALRDAHLEEWQAKRPVAIIAATRLGCLATDNDYFDTVLSEQGKLASPNLFAYTLPNCFLGEAALRFGLTGSSFIVSGAPERPFLPLQLALESLERGEEKLVVAGFCDLPTPPSMPTAEDEEYGAVFIVLAQSDNDGYGTLCMTPDGFTLNDIVISDWNQLVWQALSS